MPGPLKRPAELLGLLVTPKDKKHDLAAGVLSKLSQITEDGERKNFLRRHKLLTTDAVLQLNAATQKILRVDTNHALSLAEAAVFIARSLRKSDLLAQSYRVKANVVAAAGDYPESILLYDLALETFEKHKDQEGIARTLTAVIQPNIMLGNYDIAFKAAHRAQQILVRLRDERRLARLENNIGNIYHRQDRFEEALAHYEHAYRRLLPYADSEELTISLNNMSMCLISMNDFPHALDTYERAKELLKNTDLPLIRLITDYNIAYLYYLRGDYRRAIEMLKGARLAGERIGYSYLVALCYLDLSDIYVELNLSAEAQEVAEQGNLLFRRLSIGYEAAKALANRAIAFGQEGKTRRALELFEEARPLFVHEKNEVWPWLIDLYRAIILFQQGRHYESRRLAIGAAEFFDSSFLKGKAGLCHLLLAQIAMHTGEVSEAFAESSLALALLKDLDSPILRYQAFFLLGQMEQAKGESVAAYAAYQRSRKELENLRSSLGRDELKISFMKNRTELYERLVELCIGGELKGSSPEEAFDYVELAKSRSLTELMLQRSHSTLGMEAGQSDLVHKIRDLREELNWYQHRIELEQLRPSGNSEKRIEQLHSEAQAREKQILAVLREVPQGDPASAALSLQTHLPLKQIRQALNEGEVIVEYFFLGERIVAAVLTKESLEIVPLSSLPQVSETLRLLRFQLGRFQMPKVNEAASANLYRATLAHLRDLDAQLLAPIRTRLAGRHVVLVPHGILHYLPFHALYDGEKHLIDTNTVSYAPSASVYALSQQQHVTGGKALVLGVPDSQAPLIRSEVESVHRTLAGSALHVGGEVDHRLFFRLAPESSLIHIATHGSFRPDNPMFSGIRLHDGFLYLYELYQMRLRADLLTLSGCATGLNVLAAGDELLGLIRGALYAGARSLLISLWNVNDGSTAEFMKSFYKELNRGASKAEAFAVTARRLRDEYPHPYYWAPFLIVGKALSGHGTAG